MKNPFSLRLSQFHIPKTKPRSFEELGLNRQALIKLILKGALVGIIAGFFGATFRWGILTSEHIRWHLMEGITPLGIVLWLILMVVMAFIIDRCLKWAPLSGGSGIPQIEGEMVGLFDMKPGRTLISKYIGGILTGLAGFSVGREGPAVQLGGSVGKLISYFLKSSIREQRLLTSAGSAAGLTAAFSAPVSGAIFVFEEVHKSFYPLLVVPTFVATICSNFVTSTIFGLEPALGFSVMEGLPINYFGLLLLMGIFMGLVGVFFCRMIFLMKDFFAWMKVPSFVKLAITFITIALIGFDSQLLLGGGNDLVGQLAYGHYGILLLAGIVLGKVLVTTFCYGSGAQGGIFLPMLVIGGAAGALSNGVFLHYGLIGDGYTAQFVICAMGGMLAAAMRTPLLAILLVLEMTDSFSNIFAVGTVTMVAYLVAEMLKEPPIYDSLLQAMTKDTNVEPVQTFFQTKVPVVSPYIGVALKDLHIPSEALIVSINRNGDYIVPLGDVKLAAGDEVQVSCKRGCLREAKAFFQATTNE